MAGLRNQQVIRSTGIGSTNPIVTAKPLPAHRDQSGHFAARRSQSHLMWWLNWANRPNPGPVTLSNQTASRAPPFPGVPGNVLVLPERISLTQRSASEVSGDSRATDTHPGVHLFPSSDSGSSGSPRGLRCRQSPSQHPRIPGVSEVEQRRGKNISAVAVANKNTRIAWALLSKKTSYQTNSA